MKGFSWAVLLLAAACMPARAQGVLAHIRETGTLTCAAEERPGFADEDQNGDLAGLALELCHAVSVAVLGPAGRAELSMPDSDLEFAGLAKAPPDLVFFSGGTIADHHLAASLIPGPTVFIDPLTLLVPAKSSLHAASDLAGHTICLMIGSPEQRAVEEVLGPLRPEIARMTYREEVEMLDAYNVGACDAMAGTASTLAGYRLTTGINHLTSRFLDTPMALVPIVAATPSQDAAWASLAGWILQDLIAETGPQSAWRSDQDHSTPGLRPGWRDDVHKVVGTYNDMRNRSMGDGSRFRLPVWPNALWPQGLLLATQP